MNTVLECIDSLGSEVVDPYAEHDRFHNAQLKAFSTFVSIFSRSFLFSAYSVGRFADLYAATCTLVGAKL